MIFTESGIRTSTSEPQFLNASLPTTVTEAGSSTELNLGRPLNIESPLYVDVIRFSVKVRLVTRERTGGMKSKGIQGLRHCCKYAQHRQF